MAAIYIDRKDADLDFDAGALAVRLADGTLTRIPLAGAERVVVRRAGRISLRLLASLGERGVGLLVLGGRKGEPKAHLLGAPHGDAVVRLGQFALAAEPVRALDVARFAVKGKLGGHVDLLRRAVTERPDRRKALGEAESEIEAFALRLGGVASLDVLRGLEGAAAASFYRGFVPLFPDALRFSGRNRRPPRDPVNACLSLSYTLLYAEAVRAAWVAGLDPFVGFLHAPAPGRESLAADLVELCRPAADEWVWRLFRTRTLRANHFSTADGACLLGKAGRAAFYESYETVAKTERRRLRHAAALIARAARAAPHSLEWAT